MPLVLLLIAIDPELTLALFLPPLLRVSAYRGRLAGIRSNLRPIPVLAIGTVSSPTSQ